MVSGVISRIFRSSHGDPFWMYHRSCWMRSAIFSKMSACKVCHPFHVKLSLRQKSPLSQFANFLRHATCFSCNRTLTVAE